MAKIYPIRGKYGKYDATTAPLKSNDVTENFRVGSPYIDVVHKQFYKCLSNAEGEARWRVDVGVGEFVVNKTAAAILKGSVVYQDSAQGGTPTIVLARADQEITSSGTWGFVIEDIPKDGFGYVLTTGILSTLDTAAVNAGDPLFLSEATAGGYRTTPPPSGNHLVFLGKIDLSHANEGVINVRITNGSETHELHNVSNVPADTDMQVMTYNAAMAYYSPDLVIAETNNTGVVSWDGAGDYYDPAFPGGVFSLSRGFSGRIKGKEYVITLPQDTGSLAANTTNFIYIDSAGNIQKTTTRSHALFLNNIVLFEVLYDGANYEVVKEDHPYDYPAAVANDMHDIVGTVFEPNTATMDRVTTGTGPAGTDREVKQVGDAEMHDHGLESELLDSSGSGVITRHYYTNGGGYWNRYSLSTEYPMFFNLIGTATPITLNRHGVFRLYLSKDDKNGAEGKLFSIMHTAEFTTLVQAQTAIANNEIVTATNELALLEMAFYGYVIVKNNSSGGYIIEVDIQKSVLGGAVLAGGSSNQASLILTTVTQFDKILGPSDTTVQAALETLDEAGATSGEIDTGTIINKLATPAALEGSKYKTHLAAGNPHTGSAASGANGDITSFTTLTGNVSNGAETITIKETYGAIRGQVTIVFDGGGSVLTTGPKKVYLEIPYDCNVERWTLLADQPGAIKIDVQKCIYTEYDAGATHPVAGDSITNSNEPEITATGVKNRDLNVTNWSANPQTLTKLDVVEVEIISVTDIEKCTMTIGVKKTGG